MLKYETYVVNHFQENTYLVYDESTLKALVIDPGAPDKKLDLSIQSKGLKLEAIVCTHCHPDHVAGAEYYHANYRAPFFIHENEKMILEAYNQWAPALGFPQGKVPTPNGFVKAGDDIPLGQSALRVLETPGHTPGGICFHCAAQKVVFTGDTLFRESIGRSDFPGGNSEQLIQSITSQLLTLPEDTVVQPGHGPSTLVSFEKTSNPYI